MSDSQLIIGFIVLAIALRLLTLAVSIRNERRLRDEGAMEYGAANSLVLALAHAGYYVAAIAEGIWRSAPVSTVTVAGLVLYALSMCALVWVIRQLGRLWTVKVMIARGHHLVTNRLFRAIRHPNYYLNIIPELIGFALALQAWFTLALGLPVYAVILFARIRIEERAMRENFSDY